MTNFIKISKHIIKTVFVLLTLTGIISCYLNIFYYPKNLEETSLMQKNIYFLEASGNYIKRTGGFKGVTDYNILKWILLNKILRDPAYCGRDCEFIKIHENFKLPSRFASNNCEQRLMLERIVWMSFTQPPKKDMPIVNYSLGSPYIIYRGKLDGIICEYKIYFINYREQLYSYSIFYKEDNIPIGTATSYGLKKIFRAIPDTAKIKQDTPKN